MIWRLAVQQARAQRRYVILTLVFTFVAVALATFAATTGATQAVIDHGAREMRGEAGNNVQEVFLTDGPERSTPSGEVLMPVDEFNAEMDRVLAAGSDAVAVKRTFVTVVTAAGWTWLDASAMSGAYDFEQFLVDGRAPRDGEIVVGSTWASEHGVELGSTLRLEHSTWDEVTETETFDYADVRVVGLLKDASVPVGYTIEAPVAILGWPEAGLPEGLFDEVYFGLPDELPQSRQIASHVWWSTQRPALDSVGEASRNYDIKAFELTDGGAWTGGIALLIIFGTVTMAFALGRSQAQRRLQWVATARTLGATRASINVAASIDAVATGALAGALGYGVGHIAADAHLTAARGAYPDALLPASAAHPLWVVLTSFGLALILAAVIAAVPAFWAGRVAPVAALKPVTDVSESEVSRRISPRWIWGIAAALAIFTVGGYYSGSEATEFWVPFTMLAFIVAFIAAVLDGFRSLAKAIGAWLSRRRAPWAISAGEAIVARPRQVATPMLLTFLPVGVLAGAGFMGVLSYASNAPLMFGWYAESPGWLGATLAPFYVPGVISDRGYVIALVAAALFQFMCVAITLSGARATAADGATQQALGLTSRAQQWAVAARHGVPQAIAAVLGAIAGVGIATVLRLTIPDQYSYGSHGPDAVVEGLMLAAAPLLALLMIALSVVAAGAAVVALASRTSTPVRALARAH